MKSGRKRLFIITGLTAVLTLNVGLYVNLNKKSFKLDAYSGSSLPTTIYLNDCSEQEIRSYYSSLNSLDASERKGTNLLKNLKPILMNNQKYYGYDSSLGDKIWQMYEISDRDWEKSPASSTTYGTYNSETNTITNYQYGTSGSNSKNNPYIHALYINRNIENQTLAWGNHNQDGWGINREHIWAKSHGFQAEGAAGARGDPMHLWAANGYANNIHSNYFYAFVDKTKSYIDCGNTYNSIYNNLRGSSATLGGNQSVFEPQDCDKGDIARSIFYMVARYNNYANEQSGLDTNNPNLVLVNDLSENDVTGTSDASHPYGMGLLSDLLAWNKLDPVDEYERHRNNLLYRNYTNNRNPFIDFPNWADAIWGTADLDGSNYNSTTVGVATPASDPIGSNTNNAFSISSDNLNIELDYTAEISADHAEGNITWTIGDDTIVNLDKTTSSNNEVITITGIKEGSTTITATSGGDSLTCLVTVSRNPNGSLLHPLTIAEAKQIIDDNNGALTEDKMYVKGIVSSNSAINNQYQDYEIWLQSDDGLTTNTFELYRAVFDQNITDDYLLVDSMQGYEVIAYGYAKKYNSTYELAPSSGRVERPTILSIEPANIPEKTPKELIEETNTTTNLSYRYTKETTGGGTTDTLNHSFIGISGTTYSPWSNKTGSSGVVYAGQSAGGDNNSGDAIQLRSKNENSGIVVTANDDELTASSIEVTWNSATANGRTLNVYGKNTAYSAPTNLYNDSSGTLIGTIVKGTSTSLDINGSYEYIGLRSDSGALYLDELQIVWGGESVTTYEYSDVSIRFGGLLSQEAWNNLDTENHVIEGFGVMITTKDYLGENQIKNSCNSAILAESNPDIDSDIVNHYMSKVEMNVPPTRDSNYFWNLFFRITDYTKVYVAAAYIKTSSEYIFFRQVTCSVKTLAGDYINNRGYASNVADGSLNNLANLPIQ